MAEDHGDNNRPVDVAFTKWVTTSPLMEGYWGGDLANKFVGEVLQRQVSVNPALNGIVRLEAIYEIENGDRSTRLISLLGCSRSNPARQRPLVFKSSNQCSTTTMLASVAFFARLWPQKLNCPPNFTNRPSRISVGLFQFGP